MRQDYAFLSRWEVPATAEECWAILEDALRDGAIPWWPAVRVGRAPRNPAPGDEVTLVVRSPLGYRLRVELRLTEVSAPTVIAAESAGDLIGRGRLEVAPANGGAVLTWRWEVEPTRRWMRAGAFVLRPAFTAAHRVVMYRGEKGFRALVAERR